MNTKYTFKPDEICPVCGKTHSTAVKETYIKDGAINDLPLLVKKYNATRAFIIADVNTYPIGGERIVNVLEAAGIPTSRYVFPDKRLEPNEKAVGSLLMHYDHKCDIIIAFGSGVINDLGKYLSSLTDRTYIIVASAAYMDGYASGNSSVIRDGVKVTLNSKSPDVIMGDTDVLKSAPAHMAKAGLGDMLAKYISITEWRLANLINGEYFCEDVAAYTRSVREACVAAAPGIPARNGDAIATVFKGLVDAGMAMDFAGSSRPGGGGEHYFSHLFDMRGLEFGTPVAPHGMQAAIGTLYSIKAFEALKKVTPNREKALAYARSFDFEDWSNKLREFLGKGAEAMIALEAKERKYDLDKHRARLDVILEKWDDILAVIDEELPSSTEVEALLASIGAPKSIEDIGMDKSILPMTLMATKDIRDKYILSRLLFDLGVLDEVAAELGK
ncbi:MAG: sn-glycerol-1-phosphate dehydrogenase [Ruminococcaceae bacterium]|nr:sn-glycerol-1-phosphate dehydrogenase [Oscillospiraceae bacterium]